MPALGEMRSPVLRLALVFAQITVVSTIAGAGPCQPSLAPSPSAGAYGYQKRGDRCEGIYVTPVSGRAIEVVSLLRGDLGYDLQKPPNLSVRLAIAPSDKSKAVHIRAVGIPKLLYYQMDAEITSDQTVTWPIGEVVKGQQIGPNLLGIYAFRQGTSADTIYWPVVVAPAGSAPAAAGPINLVLRVEGVSSPKWRFVTPAGNPGELAPARVAEDRITIALPANLQLPGNVELRWNEAATGTSHVKLFAIGE